MMRLRLCENMRALGYAPFYFALANGHFEAEGLGIELITSPSASRTGAMLLEGAADVSWGGPMRVMLHHEQDARCPLVCFAQIVARDPFVLVGRTPNRRFRFQDLTGRRVAVVSEVPTPWMMLLDDLDRAGVDPASLLRLPGMDMHQSAEALLAGEADVVQVFEPYVDHLLRQGCHVWHRSTDRGDFGYTTFYATRGFVTSRREACRRLVRGMATAQAAFHRAGLARIAAAMTPFFPEHTPELLMRIAGSYRRHRLWARTPDLPVSAFVRLKAALLNGGLITSDFPYERIVDAGLSRSEPT